MEDFPGDPAGSTPCSGLLRTGDRRKRKIHEKPFDELGVLLPIHEFEKKMLQHMEEIDGIVLACRERMMELAGNDSLKL
ncbi:MAG: DUF4866 family protein [Ruminococcus sp.]